MSLAEVAVPGADGVPSIRSVSRRFSRFPDRSGPAVSWHGFAVAAPVVVNRSFQGGGTDGLGPQNSEPPPPGYNGGGVWRYPRDVLGPRESVSRGTTHSRQGLSNCGRLPAVWQRLPHSVGRVIRRSTLCWASCVLWLLGLLGLVVGVVGVVMLVVVVLGMVTELL